MLNPIEKREPRKIKMYRLVVSIIEQTWTVDEDGDLVDMIADQVAEQCVTSIGDAHDNLEDAIAQAEQIGLK